MDALVADRLDVQAEADHPRTVRVEPPALFRELAQKMHEEILTETAAVLAALDKEREQTLGTLEKEREQILGQHQEGIKAVELIYQHARSTINEVMRLPLQLNVDFQSHELIHFPKGPEGAALGNVRSACQVYQGRKRSDSRRQLENE